MKQNEIPEKIYVSTDPFGCLHAYDCENHPPIVKEYVHKDIFIENVCKFIQKGGNRGDAYIVTEFGEEVFNFVQFAEDLKNYIKGE